MIVQSQMTKTLSLQLARLVVPTAAIVTVVLAALHAPPT